MNKTKTLLFLGSIFPLALALVAQYGFALFPCKLCLLQRWPYGVVAILFVLSFFTPRNDRVLIIAIICWLATAGIAAYQVGVEQGIIEGTAGCVGQKPKDDSIDALREAILNSPAVSCATPAFTLFGISMAGYNALYGLFLSGCGAYLLTRKKAQ